METGEKMVSERRIILDGFITLEGRFLEKLWAAYLLTHHVTIRERYETGGYHHDVLAYDYSASTLYECTGQERMTTKKIEKLGRDAFLIRKAIQDEGEPPLKKVTLVAALRRDSWDNESKQIFEIQKKDLEANGMILDKIEDYDVLYPLIHEGVLGFAFIQNRLFPVGPEEYGIRYDKTKGRFSKGFAPLDIEKFKRLPQSFLPSLFWGTFYQEEQRRWAEEELEAPLAFQRFWAPYAYGAFGIRWHNAEEIRELYKKRAVISRYIYEDYKDNVLVGYSWSRRYDYPGAYIFDASPYLDREKISELLGRAFSAIREDRVKRGIPMETYRVSLVTSTEDWSPSAWWETRKTGRTDVVVGEVVRGADLLIELLNEGLLGFAFADATYPNRIQLVGPDIPALRIKEGKLSKNLLL